MKLVIAEKPSVAQSIARVIGAAIECFQSALKMGCISFRLHRKNQTMWQ